MDKAYILQEIRRTAAANGGKPLGSQRFAAETGIQKTDWVGKLWARWNDALREAGFAPNQLQQAYDKKVLLEKYAKLAQKLGRLPPAYDLRLEKHNDPDFPSHNVFSDRLGTKAELVQQLLQFCQGREGYQDVIRLCEAYVPRNQIPSDEAAPQEENFGFVYLLKSGRFYKIGKSNAVGRREYELGILLPQPVIKVHEIRTDDPGGIEAYWHKRFEAKRQSGEWFDLDAKDVAAFKRRKFM